MLLVSVYYVHCTIKYKSPDINVIFLKLFMSSFYQHLVRELIHVYFQLSNWQLIFCLSVCVYFVFVHAVRSSPLLSSFSFLPSWASGTKSIFWKVKAHIIIEVDYFFRACNLCSYLNDFLIKVTTDLFRFWSKSAMKLVIIPQVLLISLHFHFQMTMWCILTVFQSLLLFSYEKFQQC